MSCSDCTDAIPGVYTRLGILAEQQQQQLDKVFARTQQLGMPSSQDILRLSQKFLGWAQHYHNELGKLTAQQAADFEGMVTKDLYTHEQALCVSAVNIATNLNSMLQSPSLDMREQSKILHDYAFLKMLADETM